MSKDKDNPGLSARVGKVELALFGADGRGGMVKDISGLVHDVSIIKKTVRNKKRTEELSLKWKVAIGSSTISALALVAVEILKLIFA